MLDDLKKLLGADADQFASEVQKLSSNGQFDPFALLAGETRWHSVFLSPFSPAMAEARQQFLADGSGPLAGVVQQFQQGGTDATAAAQNARTVFTHAQGMCVIVLAGDRGLDTIPQLFFGHLAEAYRQQVVQLCGDQFPFADGVRGALAELERRAQAGATWPSLHAGGERDTRAYWGDLAQRLITGVDAGLAGQAIDRLRDLAHWIAAAVAAMEQAGVALAIAHQPAALRVRALSGDLAGAFAGLSAVLARLEDEEALVTLVLQLGDAAIAQGQAAVAAAWHAQAAAGLEERFPRFYELRLARFRVVAAHGVDAAAITAAANGLVEANRKNARHDLSREPVWRVTTVDPGELIDTAQAAELVGRSPTFVAKRLDQGTIPHHRSGDQVRLPKAALMAWKSVMDQHKLLD